MAVNVGEFEGVIYIIFDGEARMVTGSTDIFVLWRTVMGRH
jgi:hypothetical protein